MTEFKTIEIEFEQIDSDRDDSIAYLRLNRPEAANAFSAKMLDEILVGLKLIQSKENTRVLIISGRGKHFSAGADLNWMKQSANLTFEENITDASKLKQMFESLYHLSIPTIAVVSGCAFGGAVGLAACCDYAFAYDTAKFCLSETRLGLIPAVILPYLSRKIPSGQLRRLGLTAQVFSGEQAKHYGLIEEVITTDTVSSALKSELNSLLSCGPKALASYKKLLDQIQANSNKQDQETVEAIAIVRTGDEAQNGLQAFFDKKTGPWSIQLPKDWKFHG
ncbi:MAG: enoyl-CoA hydratase-related protein [Bdellovibrionota bacterium]